MLRMLDGPDDKLQFERLLSSSEPDIELTILGYVKKVNKIRSCFCLHILCSIGKKD